MRDKLEIILLFSIFVLFYTSLGFSTSWLRIPGDGGGGGGLRNCETIYNLPAGEKGKFAVCVKGMDFPLEDLSVRMVEWLEVLPLKPGCSS